MSYFFRQQQMQRAATRDDVQKDGLSRALDTAVEFAARARSLWDESKVTRGKTTPESTPGSFAPRGGVAGGVERTRGGRKWNDEAKAALKEVQYIGYRRLAAGRRYTFKTFEADMQREMRDNMGAGYEDKVATMAHRIWTEFEKNGPHTYYEPRDWMRTVRL